MTIAEDFWLRGQAAQRDFLHVTSYSTAFAGTAALQALHLGLTAPRAFWTAMARVASAPNPPMAEAGPDHAAAVQPVEADAQHVAANAGAEPEPEQAPPIALVPSDTAAPQPEEPSAGPSPHLLDAPRGGTPDDLTLLSGVGAKLAATLNEFGIYHYDQIAALDAEGIDWLDAQQKGFRMLCARYDLVGQAKARTKARA